LDDDSAGSAHGRFARHAPEDSGARAEVAIRRGIRRYSLRIVSRDPGSVRRAALIVLRVVGWIAWVVGILILIGRLDWAVQVVGNVVDTKLHIGVATNSAAAIFAGFAVLAGTYVLVKMLRVLLEIELLPRLSLDHGVSFAVSTVVRYCLIIAGVLLAMAANIARICLTVDGSSMRRYRGSVSSNVANRRSARVLRSNSGRSAVDNVAPSRATFTFTPKLRKGATIHAIVVVGSVWGSNRTR